MDVLINKPDVKKKPGYVSYVYHKQCDLLRTLVRKKKSQTLTLTFYLLFIIFKYIF